MIHFRLPALAKTSPTSQENTEEKLSKEWQKILWMMAMRIHTYNPIVQWAKYYLKKKNAKRYVLCQ